MDPVNRRRNFEKEMLASIHQDVRAHQMIQTAASLEHLWK